MTRITLKHVADAAGVSVQTASHILNTGHGGAYRPETRATVEAAARRLGYRPNAAARSILTQRSNIVGAVLPVLSHSWIFPVYAFETIMGINRVLMPRRYVTSIIAVEALGDPDRESRVFREQTLDGVIIVGWAPDLGRERIEGLAPITVWCDANVNQPTGCIRRDEVHAGRLAADALIARGYRRLVWVGYAPAPLHYSHHDRFAGLQQVAARRRIPLEVVACADPAMAPDAARLRRLLTPDTAVVTEHQPFATLVVHLAMRHRLTAGYDFGLASCDCSREQSTLWPDLSTVVVDRSQLGATAADMLLAGLRGSSRLPASVTVRGRWHPGATAPGPRRRTRRPA